MKDSEAFGVVKEAICVPPSSMMVMSVPAGTVPPKVSARVA